jgi:hypothetical protein
VRVHELMDEACERTGLEDFGDDRFRQGLDVLVRSLGDEAQLNQVGELALAGQIVSNLANRLRVTDWLAADPHVTALPVERPIFIIGMPRTGTTLLSNLLAQDRALRPLMRWEALNSVPPPEAATFHTDPRIEEAKAAGGMLDVLNPRFKAMHHEPADGPTECVAVYSQDFTSILFETVANIPSYGEWLDGADYTSACAYHRRLLQLLQSRAPGRWALKSPGHLQAIEALTATYPDASYVATHRDPATVVASTCSLVASLSGTFSDADHRAYIARRWTGLLAELARRGEDRRSRDPSFDRRVVDVAYADLVADPMATVRAIYERVDAELTAETEAAMAAYLAANPQNKFGPHAYRLADLLLDRDEIDALFAGYRKRHSIPADPQEPS